MDAMPGSRWNFARLAVLAALVAAAVAAPPALARQPDVQKPSDILSEGLLDSLEDGLRASTSDDGEEEDTETFVVDKDEQQCPDPDFNSIQLAVTAASSAPGSLILVCPDTYNEDVTVPQTLTLQAVRDVEREDDDGDEEVEFEAANPTRNCFTPAVANPTRDAIVDGLNNAFTLQANDVVVDGFVIQNNGVGVQTATDRSGYRVSDNLVQDNQFVGVDLRSDAQRRNSVKGNCVRSNQQPPGFQAFGISETGGNTGIKRNSAFRHRVDIVAGNTTNVRVSENRTRDSQLVSLFSVDATEIEFVDNSVLRPGSDGGVRVINGTGNRIEGNSIRQGTGPGIVLSGGNTDLQIEDNDVRENAKDGIRAEPLGSLTDSRIEDNEVRDNGEDGIHIEGGANGPNVLRDNLSLGHAAPFFDCRDDTVGLMTGGTLNTWIHNVGRTDNRGGALCRRKKDKH